MIIKYDLECTDRLYLNDYTTIIIDVQTICTSCHMTGQILTQSVARKGMIYNFLIRNRQKV